MSRRSRGKRNNSSRAMVIIIAAIIVILCVLLNSDSFTGFGGESSCGIREEDSDRNGYCLTLKSDYDELVIVAGNTQNSPAPDLDFTQGELYDLLGGVFYNTKRGDIPKVSIVSVSGSNKIIEYKAKYKPAKNISASNNELKKLGKELNAAIKTSPSEPGANYIGGIIEANNLISNSSNNPLIIVVGSGYSDSGALNFASGEIFANFWRNESKVKEIVSQNRSAKEFALSGKTIYWYNLGEVAKPQDDMNNYKEDTKAIYEIILSDYFGASKVAFISTGISGDAKSVESEYSVQQTYVDELKVGDTFSVNENVGRFYPNEGRLMNSLEVEEKLASFARRFNPNSQTKLLLTGYIARCADDGQLGRTRANTIKSVLEKLGIPSNKIESRGERGSPPEKEGEAYTCNSSLPETERRTVQIEVVKE